MNSFRQELIVKNLKMAFKTHNAGHIFTSVKRKNHILFYVQEGSLQIQGDFGDICVNPGFTLYIPKGVSSKSFYTGEVNKVLNFNFDILQGSFDPDVTLYEPNLVMQNYMDKLIDEEKLLSFSANQIFSSFYGALTALESGTKLEPKFEKVHYLMMDLEKNYALNLKVSDYAKELLMSESSLRSLFKQYTGHSIIDYRNRIRVQRAEELIAEGVKTYEAAYAVGFSSPAFYCRMAKKYKTTI